MYNPSRTWSITLAISTSIVAQQAIAEFNDDSHLTLEARNFYINRDFRDNPNTAHHKAEEWGQGFMLRYNSGFTEGTLGFGVDALGLLGVKLDAGRGTTGAGALPVQRDGEVPDSFGFIGPTAKVKMAKSLLTVGTHAPTLPIAFRNDTRLLPQTFEGAQIVSSDIDKLTLTGGQFRATRLRNSTNYEDMSMFADGSSGGVASDRFNYAGATYALLPNLTTTYFFAELQDNYSQHYGNLIHTQPLAEGLNLRSEVRYFQSEHEGRTNVDNRNLGTMLTLSYKGHALGASYQNQSGDTGMPFIGGGTDPWAFNTVTYHHFLRAREDSWQLRYDYDLATVGLPGLTFMTRYVSGDNFEIAGTNAKEWERNVDIAYVVQSGPLKNINLRLRNVAYRGSRTTDIDENRIIVGYTFKFW
ncbi:OprD family porin [Pseudomonas silesiensis]|uniref:OprD family porin n=1 Tax=Pseudomonas silesiensis TaxID=1853130 RepID=UPI0034D3BE25